MITIRAGPSMDSKAALLIFIPIPIYHFICSGESKIYLYRSVDKLVSPVRHYLVFVSHLISTIPTLTIALSG